MEIIPVLPALGEGNILLEARIRFRATFPPPYNNFDHIHFRYNEGTWCADNLVDEMVEEIESGRCMCDKVLVKVLEIDGMPVKETE